MTIEPRTVFRVPIPALFPSRSGERSLLGSVSSQPIMCFKELEVDRGRYDDWRAWLKRQKPEPRNERKDKHANS